MGGKKTSRELAVDVDAILRGLLRGELTIEQARRRLAALNVRRIRDLARLDVGRAHRVGVPEAVLAEGKDPKTVAEAVAALARASGYALVTRASEAHLKAVKAKLRGNFKLEHNPRAKTLLVKKKGHVFPKGGKIGVLAAGTADVPVAEEAAVAAEVMGCKVLKAYDVGVAGIHRLFGPLERMLKDRVSALVVVAGMEGTLPSLVSSLTDVPVVGVPTSVGYGVGVKGIGALITMLQSCSPKIAVCNIDNGYGAGVFAALVARQKTR
ncbi:MAG: nickel pincer cofactor biosynthesis protein LarB [Hadesarchaea archaeon]|nr:nickel pincer cofactor biosynthesis protein LarB [Hadesarchaea archaeon]